MPLCYFVPPLAIGCIWRMAFEKKLKYFDDGTSHSPYKHGAHFCSNLLSAVVSVALWIFLGGWWPVGWAVAWMLLSIDTLQRDPSMVPIAMMPGYAMFFGFTFLVAICCV